MKEPKRIPTTFPVPIFRMVYPLIKLDRMVEPEIGMAINPAKSRGSAQPTLITGQATPRRESGRPKLINARYMSASNSIVIMFFLLFAGESSYDRTEIKNFLKELYYTLFFLLSRNLLKKIKALYLEL